MESERVQSDWKQAAKAVVLVSLGERSEETIALVRNLISTARIDHPQLSELNFLSIPLPIPQLETWTYWMAAEAIGKWRDVGGEGISTEAIVSELGIAVSETNNYLIANLDKTATGTPLSVELAARLLAICEQHSDRHLTNVSFNKWLEQEVAGLSDWFTPPQKKDAFLSSNIETGCLSQLQTNAAAISSKSRLQLQEFFVPLRHLGPRTVLKLLKSLGETLTSICASYEEKRQNSLRREGAAWRAYYSLSAHLENRSLLPRRQKVEKEALLQAINKASNFKLEAEIYAVAGQVVGSLRQQTHLQAVALAQADALLGNLQSFFSKRCTTEPIFAPILKHYLSERVDISKLRRKIEVLVGCSLNQWGSLKSAQQAVLREQILAQIRPLCLEIYAECYRSLINLSPEIQAPTTDTSHSLELSLTNLPQRLEGAVSWQPPPQSDRHEVAYWEEETEDNLERDRAAPNLVDFPLTE